jgi:hypothetical protein
MQPTHLPSFRALVIALHVGALVAAAGGVSGCIASADDEDLAGEPRAELEPSGLTMNGLTMNGLTMNGLTMNGLTMNGLTMNGLTMNGLTMNGLNAAALAQSSDLFSVLDSDPAARQMFSYVVGCALPRGTNIVFPELAGQVDYTFSGELGVAPGWSASHGVCGPACQGAVSACVLSRVNALGQHVSISLRGRPDALAVTPAERAAYTHREATYLGNVFTSPQRLYACRAGGDDQTLIGRVCGHGADVSGCAVTLLGDCGAVCAQRDATDGYFSDCRSPYDGSSLAAVTVFRQ